MYNCCLCGKSDNKTFEEARRGKLVTICENCSRDRHNPDYDNLVPNEIFDIEDSDEIAEMYLDMFGNL